MFPEHYIVCAAVLTKDGKMHIGKRHSNCFTLIGALGGVGYEEDSTQGFVDNNYIFQTRSEAYKIAKKAGQILKDTKGRGVLYSEDIY